MKIEAGVVTSDAQGRECKVIHTYREDGVKFAAVRYLDGSNPQGQGALNPDGGVCECRVSKSGKSLVS